MNTTHYDITLDSARFSPHTYHVVVQHTHDGEWTTEAVCATLDEAIEAGKPYIGHCHKSYIDLVFTSHKGAQTMTKHITNHDVEIADFVTLPAYDLFGMVTDVSDGVDGTINLCVHYDPETDAELWYYNLTTADYIVELN